MVLPWQSCETSPDIWDNTLLPATRHKWTRPALTPACRRVILDLPISEGWKAEFTQAAQQWNDGTIGRPESRTGDLSITSPTPYIVWETLCELTYYRILRTQDSSIGATFDDIEGHLKVISVIHWISAVFGRLSRRAVSKQ